MKATTLPHDLGQSRWLDSGEEFFYELALTRAADRFRPTWERTNGVDGWVSLEVLPLRTRRTASTLAAAESFVQSWNDLMDVNDTERAALEGAR